MKREYREIPLSMRTMDHYGFSWMDYVSAIPSPLFVVTSYKENGKPNASLQSWACFSGTTEGFFAVLSNVNKAGHLYQTVKQTGVAVLNFPSEDIFRQCEKTIRNNGYHDDEIALSGLTAEPATTVNAPRIKECFLALESRLLWEHDITEGSCHAAMCFQVTNICVDEAHLDEESLGRYGDHGYLYNIHNPINPEKTHEGSQSYIAILQKLRLMGE